MGKKQTVTFDSSRCKISLTTAKARLKFTIEKTSDKNYDKLKDVIKLLEKEKFDLAFIKTQNIMVNNYHLKGMYELDDHIEHLREELPTISKNSEMASSILPHMCAIVWASRNSSLLPDLITVSQQLSAKYGPEKFEDFLKLSYPSEKFKSYFTTSAFPDKFVWKYLLTIAEDHRCPIPTIPSEEEEYTFPTLESVIPGVYYPTEDDQALLEDIRKMQEMDKFK
ncbi:Vacuolar protein sorting-associated protein Ist1 like protein [Aduncisulcus paluster]|uniref:Vacuolar protein sorting-associated protein Ist1 like protein n=1 Tax=Aduncisulcus paluster TaxID=2918883 RepID=A0ABQ5JR54_9EUKA|nr:Vacuolar protein sorting-associated protein Ist1 like protein [Aduncisulcus paluster]|eukprot:gnl/Carplike_NY0171/2113_a2842_681.p1 GENE.gnl/Carplike_NY0171/2113_a2842_681~~gnl/Carplike_NY0171/2113_a2842_681.p1  ORF type:complete len:245 (+),score=37.24 gnl/Carplike_NY0171/2113_a2842_681:66-737(+)